MDNHNSSIVKTSDWIITMLIMIIPIVNIVMLFVWAFGSGAQASKSNWAKAALIWIVIGMILNFVIFTVFGTAILEMLE